MNSLEQAPQTTPEQLETEVFAPESADTQVEELDLTEAGGLRNPNRASVYALDYVSAGINRLSDLMIRTSDRISTARDSVGNRRTSHEVFSDFTEGVSERASTTYESSKQSLKTMGRAAKQGVVRVVTAPATAAEKLASGMENGLNKLEARAQQAEQRKMERIVARKSEKSLKLQEKQDIKLAKEARKDSKAQEKLQVETAKNQQNAENKEHKARLKQHRKNMRQAKKMEKTDAKEARINQKREAAIKKANDAAQRKLARQAKYQEKLQNTQEAFSKRARQAKSIGKAGIQGVVSFGSGAVFMGQEAAREAKEVGGEIIQSAKNKVSEQVNSSRTNRGMKAAKKAETLLNKTKDAQKPGASYRVPVFYEDGKQ